MPAPALIAEATRRSEAVWVAAPGGRPRLVWHLWHDDALWLVGEGAEQTLPALGEHAQVTVRSRARPSDRVLTWPATVQRVAPGSPRWVLVVPLLAAARLNAPRPGADIPDLPGVWARQSTVLRLAPRAVGTTSITSAPGT